MNNLGRLSEHQTMASQNAFPTGAITCKACETDGKLSVANAHCKECMLNICEECLMYHRRFPTTRDHTIGRLNESSPVSQAPQVSPLLHCDFHDTKEVKYYCYDHKEVYCALCRVLRHQSCHDKLIAEVCGVMGSRELELAVATLDQLVGGLQKARFERQQKIDEMMLMRSKCVDEINRLQQRLSRLLAQLHQNAESKLIEVDKRAEEYRETVVLYDDAEKHVSSLVDQIQTVMEGDNKEMIFVAQTKAQKLKNDYIRLVENRNTDDGSLRLLFTQDSQIVDILSTCESLGDVWLEQTGPVLPSQDQASQAVPQDIINMFLSKPENVQPVPSAYPVKVAQDFQYRSYTAITTPKSDRVDDSQENYSDSPDIENISTSPIAYFKETKHLPRDTTVAQHPRTFSDVLKAKPNTVVAHKNSISSVETLGMPMSNRCTKNFLSMRIKNRKQYNINENSDKGDCDITGVTFLVNGGLALCDHYNKTIKVLDRAFNVTHSKRLGDHPWDVAVYGEAEFVVTLTKTRTVQFIKIDESELSYSTRFFTKRDCWGIESFEELLILTFHDSPGKGCVEIRTKIGQVIRQISTDNDNKELFVSPFYVALDPDKTHIYVTDGKNNSITCLTIKGKYVANVKSEHLGWPKGIAIDEESNLIVSAHYTNQLKIVKQKGRGGGTKYCEIHQPQALALRWDDLTMVISTNSGHAITVYTFERFK